MQKGSEKQSNPITDDACTVLYYQKIFLLYQTEEQVVQLQRYMGTLSQYQHYKIYLTYFSCVKQDINTKRS